MKSRAIALAITIGLAVSIPVLADMFVPSHSCRKPIKPYQFNYEWEIESFNADVDIYRACIAEFVDRAKAAASRHQQAASDAVDDWNRFVNYELN